MLQIFNTVGQKIQVQMVGWNLRFRVVFHSQGK